MKVIRISDLSGGEKVYTSFSLDSFSEIKADTNYVYLYFSSLIDSGTLVSSSYYYGTRVTFTKTGLGYQIYSEIILSLSDLDNENIVTLDYTTDDLVTTSFEQIYGPSTGGGTGGSAISVFGPAGQVTSGATGFIFTGSGVSSVTASLCSRTWSIAKL
jgi:hypothetical protein